MSKKPFDMKHLLDTSSFRGATGQFPKGKIHPDDEGELQLAIGHGDGRVAIDFGTQVTFIAMEPQQAADMAATLLHHARRCLKPGESIIFKTGKKQ